MEQLAQGIQGPCGARSSSSPSNLIAHNDKVRAYLRDIRPIIELKPDA